jgi:hypothetical protein
MWSMRRSAIIMSNKSGVPGLPAWSMSFARCQHRSTDAGTPPDQTHVEPDALQPLLARFEPSGYVDVVSFMDRDWQEPAD